MSVELTQNDLLILEKQRLQRFRCFFNDTLPFCFLHLNQKNVLSIHCSEPWLVDQLLCEIDQLCWYAWVVVGASRVSMYFAQEKIYTTKTRNLAAPSSAHTFKPANSL